MSEEEMRKAALAGHELLDGFTPFLDTLDGMVASARRRGFTEGQSRAIVAYMFGWRPDDGSKPEGVDES